MDLSGELLDYELFRNGILVGRIRFGLSLEVQDQVSVFGLLEPTPAFDDICVMSQTRMRVLPSEPVFQRDVASARIHGTEAFRGPQFTPEKLGVAQERVLSLRRSNGEVVEADAMYIVRNEDQLSVPELQAFCAAHGLAPGPWGLVAVLSTDR